MGKSGQPVDEKAWAAKRRWAVELLERGYSSAVVGRNVGASKSWVNRVNQERLVPRPPAPSPRLRPKRGS